MGAGARSVLGRLGCIVAVVLLVGGPAGAPAQSPPDNGLGPECDPNYALVCVPIASDVDCAGGRGNGPEYVVGPVQVIGDDIYELDREGDGIACEPVK